MNTVLLYEYSVNGRYHIKWISLFAMVECGYNTVHIAHWGLTHFKTYLYISPTEFL